ncbi:glycosyltransferase family 2 protein [Flavobacterium chungbukense]|uniref:Glycosyltransferase 2-like domain-containing protein n=1 Tax=Flavobacterium chungbukense TaxID=877464 RepID=A0ABP7XK06_9FLAO|nr:glycosyltransferase family 2 protein [Flavobacterium chungbukense]MCC4922970.1 glycosyltransferase [Flavobacterium chungbukense]
MERIKSPLISVITVSYNAKATIERTILSVLNQTYSNIEYIIIDGGSKDGTVDIIEQKDSLFTEKGISFKYISEKDDGIYYAMNKGIKMANGELVALLNADDWYESGTIEKVVTYYQSNTEIDIFHGILRFVSMLNGEAYMLRGSADSFLKHGMIEHPTCFIKKSLYEKVGYFNVLYKNASDYDWMLRAKKTNAKFLLIPYILTNFQSGGVSDSLLSTNEELLIKRRHGIMNRPKYVYKKIFAYLLSKRKS